MAPFSDTLENRWWGGAVGPQNKAENTKNYTLGKGSNADVVKAALKTIALGKDTADAEGGKCASGYDREKAYAEVCPSRVGDRDATICRKGVLVIFHAKGNYARFHERRANEKFLRGMRG